MRALAIVEKYVKWEIIFKKRRLNISLKQKSYTCSDEALEKIMQVNFFGVIRLTNLVLSYMLKDDAKSASQKSRRRNYSIVNVGSVQSYLGLPYRGPCMETYFKLLLLLAFMFLFYFK